MLRTENNVGNITHPKFHPVIALQPLPLHAFAVHVGSVLAALVHDEEIAILRHD